MRTWFPHTGYWWNDRGRWIWSGPNQVEDRSPESVSRCYRFLLSVPYQTYEDRKRLDEQWRVDLAEAIVEESCK